MKRFILLGIVLTAGLITGPVSAGNISASGILSAQPDGSNWDYTITLTNTSGPGGDNIETFWYSWVPGTDFLPTKPISVSPPSGWGDEITHFGGSSDGYAIMFTTTTASLAPGSSSTFKFVSADTPAQLAGNSPFGPTSPVGTSFVYSGGAFVSDGALLVVASVPEPSTLTLGMFGLVASLAGWRTRRPTLS